MIDAAQVATGTALQFSSRRVKVHLLGQGISRSQILRFQALCDKFKAELVHHPVTEEWFDGASQKDPNISLLTLARMYLPRLVKGRVLYLDCDIRVCDDIADLYSIDLQGMPLGAVRDFLVLRAISRGHQLPYPRKIMGGRYAGEYFNAGVLLMDCDAINRDAKLLDGMIDMEHASKFDFLDQDLLNMLFAGRTYFLPLRWNNVWDRGRYTAAMVDSLSFLSAEEKERVRRPAIVHYTGPKKPWKNVIASAVLRGRLGAVLKYRFACNQVMRGLPRESLCGP